MLNESAALGSELPFLDFVFGFCVSLERGWRDWRETLLDQQAGKSVPGILIRIQNSLLHKLKWVLKSLVKVHGWGRGRGGFVCFPERISTFFLYFYVVKCFPGSKAPTFKNIAAEARRPSLAVECATRSSPRCLMRN